MKPTEEQAIAQVIEIMRVLETDLGGSTEPSAETKMLSDMNWSSLNVIVLANATQEYYQRIFPFDQLFLETGYSGASDISVRDWAEFIRAHYDSSPPLDAGS